MTAGDGTRLVCWDFGGHGTPLLMVHGAGLHGRCWAPLAGPLCVAGFHPLALDMRGHGASGHSPYGSYNWQQFELDVLETLDQLGLGDGARASGVVGVGHSAGASGLLLAEASRQGSFSSIWAWEPIMSIPGTDDRARRGAELARLTRQRRSEFASIEEARAHFEGRGLFVEFSAESLEAFLSGGLVPISSGGYKLACDPEEEARIYESAADHHAWEGLPRVRCPTRLLGGERSLAVPPDELAAIAARLPVGPELPPPHATVVPLLGHFGPFQRPAEIAADIAKWAA